MKVATRIRDIFRAPDPLADPATGSTPDAPRETEPLFDEELLARLRKLVLLSRRSVSQGLAGEHRSRRRGSSPEFADFKSYSQGDDFRRIDWNIYSRLDDLFIRLSEVTTELTAHVLLDSSNSMDWRSSPAVPTKFTYARRLTGSLAYIALWHFDRVVVAPFGETLGTTFGPVHGRANISPMIHYLTGLEASGTTNLGAAIERYARGRKRPGILLIISDLLSGEPDDLQQGLRFLRTRGWQTSIVHVIDAAELSPAPLVTLGPGNQPLTMELIDLEQHQRLRLTPTSDALRQYESAVNLWRGRIEAACADEHADYIPMQTEWPVDAALLAMLHERGILA